MEPEHVVEVHRRESNVALYVPFHRKARAALGFATPAATPAAPSAGPPAGRPSGRLRRHGEEPGEVYYVHPFAPSADTTVRLARSLVWHTAPVLVSFRLRPTRLTPGEEDAFRHLLAELEVVRGLPGPSGTPLEEFADLLTLMKGQAAALSEAVSMQLSRLADTAFEFTIQVASSAPIPDGLVQELGVVVTRPAASMPASGGGPVAEQHRYPALVGGFSWTPLEGGALDAARRSVRELDLVSSAASPAPAGLERWRRLVAPAEAVSFFRLPLPDETDYPGIEVLKSRVALAPDAVPATGLVLGLSRCPIASRPAAVSIDDRRRHLYAVGQTGTGKTTFFESMILQDIRAGHGACVLDPHGELVERILGKVPPERADDVIYLDPAARERPIGLNLLEWDTPEERYFLVQELASILQCIAENPDFAGPVFHHYMRNFGLLLMANRDDPGTLVEVPRLYVDKKFHQRWLPFVEDPLVKLFWNREWDALSDFHKSEMMAYLLSKFGPLVGDPLVRNIVGQRKSGIDIARLMDERKVLLVNLAKGRLGEFSARVLGMVIVARIASAAMRRVDLAEHERPDFFLYVDEFQNLATLGFGTLLSEARKFRLSLMLTNQFLSQVGSAQWARHYNGAVEKALLGNVGTIVAFRVGVEDARLLEGVLTPDFSHPDLLNLPNFRACVSSLVGGAKVRPFTIDTVKDDTPWNPKIASWIREMSGKRYGRPVELVEKEIARSLEWKPRD
jgi:hypothetical protein